MPTPRGVGSGGSALAILDEADVGGVLAEAAAADVEAVFADQATAVVAHTAAMAVTHRGCISSSESQEKEARIGRRWHGKCAHQRRAPGACSFGCVLCVSGMSVQTGRDQRSVQALAGELRWRMLRHARQRGRREEQMVALGGCISRMVLAPGEYTAVLGSGIDAEASVEASSAAAQQQAL